MNHANPSSDNRRYTTNAVLTVAALTSGCGSSTPTTSSTLTPVPTPTPTLYTLTGAIAAANGGQPMAAAIG